MQRTIPALVSAIALVLASAPAAPATGPVDTPVGEDDEARWLAGDWHVHTNASHDACAAHNAPGLLEDHEDGCGDGAHTISADGATRMRQAQARGLDYLRITDHNNMGGPFHARAHYDGPVTLVPGYEHSLPGGHAGISTLDLFEDGVFPTPSDASGIDPLIDDVHAEEGGFFVANHPYDGGPSVWTTDQTDVASWDAIEIWNIHWLWRDDVTQGFVDDGSNNDQTLDLWNELLNEGHELPIVGASDNHWLATTAVQGPGQPTTWVKADANTPSAIIDAAREGHTYVTWDHVGPRVSFTGTDGQATAIPGDTLPADTELTFSVQVTTGAGERVRIVSCDGLEHESAPGVPIVQVDLTFDEDCWVRTDLVTVDDAGGNAPDDLVYRAITSPIYVR